MEEYSLLHDLRKNYPLAPQRLMIKKLEKLIPNLNDKEKYVIRHKNLKQCFDLSFKIKKVHRGMSFKEEPWLKKYTELNTNLRTNAKNKFEKEFFWFMNNSVFGKPMVIKQRIYSLTVLLMRLELKTSKFDASNYTQGHLSGIPTGRNNRVVEMMIDEAGEKVIEEFVGLRPKLYR